MEGETGNAIFGGERFEFEDDDFFNDLPPIVSDNKQIATGASRNNVNLEMESVDQPP